MERGEIKADPRHITRSIRSAIQGSVIRALVELITNADDSYIRLGNNIRHEHQIDILYQKKGHHGLFAVRDRAEGMSIDDIKSSLTSYGAATSGMEKGIKVRGYFGQGAKQALASMVNGKICSFKDDRYTECRLYIENGKPMYEITDEIPSTRELRNIHEIEGNGTIASFEANPQITGRVPKFKTVQEELANNFLLRKIMANPDKRVLLWDVDAGKSRPLNYQMPKGKEILVDDFAVSYGDYGDFPIHISVWRAEMGELTQTGDDRFGGLLLVDYEEAVLGISLFKYDNEPLAARFFGEVKISRFRELLDNEEPVLSEERVGISVNHPFCQKLIAEIEKYVGSKVEEERLRKQKEEKSRIGREEAVKFLQAFSLLNEIAEMEVQAVINLGQTSTDVIEPPPHGFCLYPSTAQITVGKRYAFEIRSDTKVIPYGSVINVSCSNHKIRVLTPEINIVSENGTGIIRKYITVEGTEPNIDGILYATAGKKRSKAVIYVIPEKELLLDEGMIFQPESVTLRPNQPRKVFLLVYVKMIEGGSTITITSDNESIHVSHEEIVVNEADAIRHIAKYEIEVWGEGTGQDGVISAEHHAHMALLGVRVRLKDETRDKSRKGMFNEPEYSHEPKPLQRTAYSSEDGKVIIYVNFPSVQHYLGDKGQYRKSLPAQVFVADLVAERCFHEIAKRKVTVSGATLRPEAIPDRIQRDAFELSRNHGKKVHEVLVDKDLLTESRKNDE